MPDFDGTLILAPMTGILRRISNEGIWIWKQTCVEHFEDIIALGKQENGEYERDWNMNYSISI
jgi:hypothetical protein